MTPLLCTLRNTWITVWVALELNTLSFCTLIKYKKKEGFITIEIRMKYFIIQSISSTVLVFSMVIRKEWGNNKFMWFLGLISIMIKAAASPFHQWFINIIKKSKWIDSLILITWQKLAPVYLLLYQRKLIIIPFIVLSTALGRILQINKTKITEILALSSVFNLGWMIIGIILRTYLFILFSILYWISVTFVILMVKKIDEVPKGRMEGISKKKWINLAIVANLAGIPPLTGFLAKWVILKERVGTLLIPVITWVLLLRAINFYVYLRICTPIFLKKSKINDNKIKAKKHIIRILMFNLTPMVILFSSGAAWKRTILIR